MLHSDLKFTVKNRCTKIHVQVSYTPDDKPDAFYLTLQEKKTGLVTKALFSAEAGSCINVPIVLSLCKFGYDVALEGLVKEGDRQSENYKVISSVGGFIRVSSVLHSIQYLTLSKEARHGHSNIYGHVQSDKTYSLTRGKRHSQPVIPIDVIYISEGTTSQYVVHAKKPCVPEDIFFVELIYRSDKYIFMVEEELKAWTIPVNIMPTVDDPVVRVYESTATNSVSDGCAVYAVQRTSHPILVRTYLDFESVQCLWMRCVEYQRSRILHGNDMVPIEYIYRTKAESYWDIVASKGGVMQPYTKDFNGDPLSVINGNIDGLFFSSVLDPAYLQPPLFSYFGDTRLNVAADYIFTPWVNAYFADFYCHYKTHYVTIVVTKAGSPADIFCERHLPLLDKTDNPFLLLQHTPNGNVVMTTTSVQVEIFYTDSINVNDIISNGIGFFCKVERRGRGSSTMEGIVKNQDCYICNL